MKKTSRGTYVFQRGQLKEGLDDTTTDLIESLLLSAQFLLEELGVTSR